ncbi:MAG: hypothetical protein KH304_11325 [Clostridium sp.]|nr:hypothetical protein [Clostridium sp.]
MDVQIRTKNFRVLMSGNFLLADYGADATIKVDFHPEFNLIGEITYEFVKDDETPESGIEARAQGHKLIITCKNADNILGNGMLSPSVLAEVGNKKIYHNFFVSRPGEESPRMFYYTFYTEV